MKLYTADYAPNPRRVRWIMNEKGIGDIEIVPLDIMRLEHRDHPAVAASGGNGLPVLELDDGELIGESLAIGRYLESLHPESNLFGRDPLETARIEMWTRRIELLLANPLMIGTRMTFAALKVLEEPSPPVAEYFVRTGRDFLAALDRRLEGRAFVVADRFTVADIVAVVALDFARLIRFRSDKSLENIARWLKAMRERPTAPKPG